MENRHGAIVLAFLRSPPVEEHARLKLRKQTLPEVRARPGSHGAAVTATAAPPRPGRGSSVYQRNPRVPPKAHVYA
eukprot:1849459-Pyramimonas_sp.AAC.1